MARHQGQERATKASSAAASPAAMASTRSLNSPASAAAGKSSPARWLSTICFVPFGGIPARFSHTPPVDCLGKTWKSAAFFPAPEATPRAPWGEPQGEDPGHSSLLFSANSAEVNLACHNFLSLPTLGGLKNPGRASRRPLWSHVHEEVPLDLRRRSHSAGCSWSVGRGIRAPGPRSPWWSATPLPALKQAQPPALSASPSGRPDREAWQFSQPASLGTPATEQVAVAFHEKTTLIGVEATNDFHVVGGSCRQGAIYNEGDTCAVVVSFEPKGPGSRAGQLRFTSAEAARPDVVRPPGPLEGSLDQLHPGS